jgi:hypothetical protein
MDKRGKLTRDNVMIFINKELASGTELLLGLLIIAKFKFLMQLE